MVSVGLNNPTIETAILLDLGITASANKGLIPVASDHRLSHQGRNSKDKAEVFS